MEGGLGIVQWYLSVMEDGLDTREVVKDYYDLKNETKVFKKTSQDRISKLNRDNIKLTKRLSEAM